MTILTVDKKDGEIMDGDKKLRHAVSSVVFRDGEFLMVSSTGWPEGSWCFPQGGIEEGESHFDAVKRELKEELGTDRFEIFGRSKIDHVYYFPEKIALKKGYDGQFQTIWFVRFLGDKEDIIFSEEEVADGQWFKEDEVIDSMAFPEQKDTFKNVLEELKELEAGGIF